MDRYECRFCGNATNQDNIKAKLDSDIKGFVNFKAFAEYFCRIDLDEDKRLPQECCQTCYRTILGFCIFTVNVESQQNKFKNRCGITSAAPIENREAEKQVPTENHNNSISSINNSRDSSVTSGSSKRSHEDSKEANGDADEPRLRSKRKKNSEKLVQAINEIKYTDKKEKVEMTLCEALLEVQEIFKDRLTENEIRFEKITIKDNLLNKTTGEVPQEWLRKYNGFLTWQDMKFECISHCKKTIHSLKGLLDHFDEHKISQHKRAIKCTQCRKVYQDQATNLVLFLNHMSRAHQIGHLKFTCILCDKVFVNVVKLTEHMISNHAERKLRIFPCFDCGLLFGHIEKLKSHKESHRYTDTESS